MPFTGTEQQRRQEAPTSARGRGASASHPHGSRGRVYAPQSRGSWRKTYSLKNNAPQSAVSTSSSSFHRSAPRCVTHSSSLPLTTESDGAKTATVSSGISQQKKVGDINRIGDVATDSKHTDPLRKSGVAVSEHEGEKQASSSTGVTRKHETPHAQTQEFQQRSESTCVVLPGKKASAPTDVPSSLKASSIPAGVKSSSQVQIKASLTSTESKQTITATAPASGTATPALSALSAISKQPSSLSQLSQPQVSKSKFTWIKSQNAGGLEPKLARTTHPHPSKAATLSPTSKALVASGSPSSASVSKKTPAKKLLRKLSPVTGAPKTSKYKWVSAAGVQAKTSRKPLSPRALSLSQRSLQKGDATKKLKPGASPSLKLKRGIAGSSASSSHSSRYRWKAGGQATPLAVTGGAAVARRRSAFHWAAEKSSKGVKAGLVVSPTLPLRASLPSSSPAGFKLRSRMKIIRKSASR